MTRIMFVTDVRQNLCGRLLANLLSNKLIMQHAITAENARFIGANSTVQPNIVSVDTSVKTNLLKNFMAWCTRQDENKFLWLGIIFFGHIGAAIPVTLMSILFAGNSFTLWLIALIVNVPVFPLTLAAQSTKVTLPFLFGAWVANAIIIAYCLVLILTTSI